MKNKNSTIILERYYKNCISVKNPTYDEENYIKKMGFSYTLGSNSGNKNILHISNIVSFLERCKLDGTKLEFIGFKENDYI